MIGVLTHHWTREDKVAEGRKLLDRNGLARAKPEALLAARHWFPLPTPPKITTLVVWESSDVYDAWRASPERAVAMAGAEELWARAPESERFQLVTPS